MKEFALVLAEVWQGEEDCSFFMCQFMDSLGDLEMIDVWAVLFALLQETDLRDEVVSSKISDDWMDWFVEILRKHWAGWSIIVDARWKTKSEKEEVVSDIVESLKKKIWESKVEHKKPTKKRWRPPKKKE